MQPDSVKTRTHSWAIDSIEEHVASVEIDGKDMAEFPKWLLPPGACEGQILAVTHVLSADGGSSKIEIVVDRAATERAKAKSVRAPRKTGREKADPGGDLKF